VPFAVINDFEMLASCRHATNAPVTSRQSKVACIRDPLFFKAIEEDAARLREFEPAAMERLIYRCANCT